VFYEVAKLGRFTEAARRLGISQSALSRSVALLEESEGVKLFERSKKGVALTRVGEEVFAQCEKLFQTVSVIRDTCRGSREICEGPLHFATPDHVVNHLLLQPMRSFREDHPQVVPSVSIGTPDEIIGKVVKKECEFALLFARVNEPEVEYVPLRRDFMALVVHSDLWRENKGANQAATLKKIMQRYGYISSVGASARKVPSQMITEVFEVYEGVKPRIGLEVSSQEAQKNFCLNKGGLAYLSRFMVEEEIREGSLHEVPHPDPHVFNLWLALRKEHVLSLPAKKFIERLKDTWPAQSGKR
jgi:LysR family transcriptional regulator, cyn operon transcriptional activator